MARGFPCVDFARISIGFPRQGVDRPGQVLLVIQAGALYYQQGAVVVKWCVCVCMCVGVWTGRGKYY